MHLPAIWWTFKWDRICPAALQKSAWGKNIICRFVICLVHMRRMYYAPEVGELRSYLSLHCNQCQLKHAACGQADEAIKAAILAVLLERGLKAPTALLAKVLQLWQTLQVRFGVCILGPAASGKSTVLRVLQVPDIVELMWHADVRGVAESTLACLAACERLWRMIRGPMGLLHSRSAFCRHRDCLALQCWHMVCSIKNTESQSRICCSSSSG